MVKVGVAFSRLAVFLKPHWAVHRSCWIGYKSLTLVLHSWVIKVYYRRTFHDNIDL